MTQKIFTVHEKPQAHEPADRMVLVREGFSYAALAFHVLWLIANRLWLAATMYVGLSVLLQVGGHDLGLAPAIILLLQLLLQVLVAANAYDIKRWHLARQGYREAGVLVADSTDGGGTALLRICCVMVRVAIIDCGAGNLHSVRKAIATQLPVGAMLDVTTDAAALVHATHIVLPGVGAFADCMHGLNALPGMRDALEKKVLRGTTPFLGICVGMQMLFERGHEHGSHDGLGWFKGEVCEIAPSDTALKIPHMGWNTLCMRQERHPFFTGINSGDFAYFVHSFAAQNVNSVEVSATVDYGGEVVAAVAREHIVATQFHPEKSQAVGLAMLHNFLMMN